jgi:UDP-3-O-[3-hydroxymyristoyl] N-acetylglucosamine deacetylase/3-hydroxyacyl-[acyl-carrier-protein] dehydratase
VTNRLQRTLRNPVDLRGVGLHSGKEIRLALKPAEAGNGITFVRVDMQEEPEIRAIATNLKARERRSCLQSGSAEVYTCEHLLAALWALAIDNAVVEIDGEEVPGMDGSASEFVQALRGAGAVEQKAPRKSYTVTEPLYVREGPATLVALPAASDGLTLEYHFEYPTANEPGPARQSVSIALSPESFERDIAPARTFVFEHEVEALQAAGLGKGASQQNTLVVGPNGVKDGAPRFQDELARHKVLDLVGDLATTGVDLNAHIIATRSGHSTNMKLVQQLIERIEQQEESGELVREAGLEIREIMKLLPHRYPFLLVDRVIELDGFKRAVAIKNVSVNEPFFQGHWPGQPILPGVLQLEAMAQLSGVLLLRKLENTGKLAVLWSIDKVKLRGAVVPGDQLRIEVETIRAKPSVGHVQARCKVAGKLVAEAQLKFTLIDA